MNLSTQLKWVVQAHETRSGMLGQLVGEGGCNCFLDSIYATVGSGYYSMRTSPKFEFRFQMNTLIAKSYAMKG